MEKKFFKQIRDARDQHCRLISEKIALVEVAEIAATKMEPVKIEKEEQKKKENFGMKPDVIIDESKHPEKKKEFSQKEKTQNFSFDFIKSFFDKFFEGIDNFYS